MKTLVDTVEMMINDNYKERFKGEYFQLKIRYEALNKMVKEWDDGKLKFTPTCPRSTYNIQLSAMKNYLDVLEIRAFMENIKLEGD